VEDPQRVDISQGSEGCSERLDHEIRRPDIKDHRHPSAARRYDNRRGRQREIRRRSGPLEILEEQPEIEVVRTEVVHAHAESADSRTQQVAGPLVVVQYRQPAASARTAEGGQLQVSVAGARWTAGRDVRRRIGVSTGMLGVEAIGAVIWHEDAPRPDFRHPPGS
jgi:hypothetical protein